MEKTVHDIIDFNMKESGGNSHQLHLDQENVLFLRGMLKEAEDARDYYRASYEKMCFDKAELVTLRQERDDLQKLCTERLGMIKAYREICGVVASNDRTKTP